MPSISYIKQGCLFSVTIQNSIDDARQCNKKSKTIKKYKLYERKGNLPGKPPEKLLE